jgi:hypothetical protein
MKMPTIKALLRNMKLRLPRFNWPFWRRKLEVQLMAFSGVPHSKLKGQANPIVILVAVLWSIVTIGVSLGSFFTLFASLLLLYFLLTRIFGLDFKKFENDFV